MHKYVNNNNFIKFAIIIEFNKHIVVIIINY